MNNQTTDAEQHADDAVSRIAAAIGEPARARTLYCLADGHARTSTELSVVADVSPSTTSVHLEKLKNAHLVNVLVQGKHRFYSLAGPDVARALEGLSVLAGSNAPTRLRVARTCYDHMAGMVGVLLHDRFQVLKWLSAGDNRSDNTYELTTDGTRALEDLGIEIEAMRALRRRFACPCLDWSERRPHLGGALGAALLKLALKRKWVIQDLDSRALDVTSFGRREMMTRFGLQVCSRLTDLLNNQTRDTEEHEDDAVSRIAAAIGEPARSRILYCLVDGHARTSTELSVVADVSPSTTSVHLEKLKNAHLVNVLIQGKHRFYSLAGPDVARALEGLSVLAGSRRDKFVSNTPTRLRVARTCYDHIAGMVGVSLHDRLQALKWLSAGDNHGDNTYELTTNGTRALESLGIEVEAMRALRRRLACPCLDWSEPRPHLAGALGAALLKLALKRKWVIQDLDSRALDVTSFGRHEMMTRFGLQV